jgi:hypothetical protein
MSRFINRIGNRVGRVVAALGLLATLSAVGASGCMVREQRYAARPGPACRGGYWVEGHYGPRGRWHPAHWRCPGVVERVEID